MKRVIVHPSFHNITFKDAEKLLINMDLGEVVIRPSSKVCNTSLKRTMPQRKPFLKLCFGIIVVLFYILPVKGGDHLTVTWKVDEGIYAHIDVREEGKENVFSLGTSLWIGSEVG